MMSLGYTKMQMVFRKILLLGLAFLIMAGGVACQSTPKPYPPSQTVPSANLPSKTAPATPLPPKIVDTKAQQLHYDRGIQAYSNENFEEAKAEFQSVISLGSNSVLGLKAQENLKKVKQVLKTVEEIKSK